jgi:GT2 family glycosyltransferase
VSKDSVTTVVITHNRREQLLETLPRHEGKVIVVDNASDDGTVDVTRAGFPRVTVVGLRENTGALGRTIGARLATTPYVAFADDDSWWSPGALAQAADILDRFDSIALLAARVVVEPDRGDDPFNQVLAASPLSANPHEPGTPVLGFMACASVVRRSSFLDIGGFHPLLGTGGEEELLAWDLAARRWGIRYVPGLVAHHEPRPGPARGAARVSHLRRNAILTAIMRRPWHHVARHVADGIAAGPADRAGVAAAVGQAPRALTQRRPLPAHVERQLALLNS